MYLFKKNIGTNAEGVTLLQNYLDLTGDVQSVSLIAARTFQPEILKETQVQEWISRYFTSFNLYVQQMII